MSIKITYCNDQQFILDTDIAYEIVSKETESGCNIVLITPENTVVLLECNDSDNVVTSNACRLIIESINSHIENGDEEIDVEECTEELLKYCDDLLADAMFRNTINQTGEAVVYTAEEYLDETIVTPINNKTPIPDIGDTPIVLTDVEALADVPNFTKLLMLVLARDDKCIVIADKEDIESWFE